MIRILTEDRKSFKDKFGEEALNNFLMHRNSYPAPYNDMDWWVNNPDANSTLLNDFMNSYASTTERNKFNKKFGSALTGIFGRVRKLLGPDQMLYSYWMDVDKEDLWDRLLSVLPQSYFDEVKEGSEKVYSDDTWDIYKIYTYRASEYYGRTSGWCISGNYPGAEDKGEYYFNDYKKELKQGIDYYLMYFNRKNGQQYCVLIKPDVERFNGTFQENNQVWDGTDGRDKEVPNIENAPEPEGLPKISFTFKNKQELILKKLFDDEFGYDRTVRYYNDGNGWAIIDDETGEVIADVEIATESEVIDILAEQMDNDEIISALDSESLLLLLPPNRIEELFERVVDIVEDEFDTAIKRNYEEDIIKIIGDMDIRELKTIPEESRYVVEESIENVLPLKSYVNSYYLTHNEEDLETINEYLDDDSLIRDIATLYAYKECFGDNEMNFHRLDYDFISTLDKYALFGEIDYNFARAHIDETLRYGCIVSDICPEWEYSCVVDGMEWYGRVVRKW